MKNNPFPHEHSVRVHSPSKYIRMRRHNDKLGKGIDVIFGILKKKIGNAKTEIQAIRFDAKKFTPAKVREWIDAHGGRGKGLVVEPATRPYEGVGEVYSGNPKSYTYKEIGKGIDFNGWYKVTLLRSDGKEIKVTRKRYAELNRQGKIKISKNPALYADPYEDALHTHFPSKQQSNMFADITLLKHRGADKGKILHVLGDKYGLNARFSSWLIDRAEKGKVHSNPRSRRGLRTMKRRTA